MLSTVTQNLSQQHWQELFRDKYANSIHTCRPHFSDFNQIVCIHVHDWFRQLLYQ